jgi:transposase
MTTPHKYFGIDVSKDSLQISTQEAEGIWSECKIANETTDIDRWLSSLPDEAAPFVVLEHTGTYSCRLVHCLWARGVPFCLLNPSQSAGFAKTLKKVSKTDKSDARHLFVYGQKMQPCPTVPDSDEAARKKALFKHLTALKDEKRRFENRQHAASYNPRADALITESTKRLIETLDDEIRQVEEELFKDNGQDLGQMGAKAQTVVGIGPKSAEAILTATNGLANFDNAKQVAKFLGVCPTDYQSGASVRGKAAIPKSANGYVRKCLYMAARSARLHNMACKALYERLRAKGKPYRVAIIAVVHKLIKQVFFVAKNNATFDNQICLAK